MAISETIYFIITFGLAVVFTVFAWVLEENKILLKFFAGLCWIIFGVMQWVLTSPPTALVYTFSFLGFGLGFLMWAWIFQDYYHEKNPDYGNKRKMGEFD